MSISSSRIFRRQSSDNFDNDPYDDGYWYYSNTAIIIKWIFAGIILLIAFAMVFSYLHATSRLKRGQAPLPYHRWLVKRQMARAQAYDPNYQQPTQMFSFYNNNTQQPPNPYGQQNFPAPPPVYNPHQAGEPPAYYPPAAGDSTLNTGKVDYSQAAPQPNVHGEGGSGPHA